MAAEVFAMDNLKFLSGLPPLSQLRVAVKTEDPATVRAVLDVQPQLLNFRDESGATPLHWAVEWQVYPVVVALVELGADATILDHQGYTPYDLAAQAGEYANGAYTELSKKIVRCLGKGGTGA